MMLNMFSSILEDAFVTISCIFKKKLSQYISLKHMENI